MKNLGDLFFSYIKEGYKKEFLIWLLSIIILILSLFILIKELKKFMVLNKSKEEVERSYISLQPQIVQIKKNLSQIDWNMSFKKTEIQADYKISLKDLNQALTELAKISSDKNNFFLLEEMRLQYNQTLPFMSIKGIVVRYD